ncbi:tRNA-(ms[2]io[6]A)-hydroxylase [Enterobacter cloacae subsp. cloacae]|nr:tRNA-(ms[2]io[6]A)-hydroxylase [Enterobacter cloacae subsp. cloacae]
MPDPQAWIDKARDPANLPLLLCDHMVCRLKGRLNRAVLVRKYVADESGADALLDWLKPYEQFTFRDGPEPDFIALHRQIGKSVMPKTDARGAEALIDGMVLLIKERSCTSLAGARGDAARDIPYVKITASRYAKRMLKRVRTPRTADADPASSSAVRTIEARSLRTLRRAGRSSTTDLQKFYLSLLRSGSAPPLSSCLTLAQQVKRRRYHRV